MIKKKIESRKEGMKERVSLLIILCVVGFGLDIKLKIMN